VAAEMGNLKTLEMVCEWAKQKLTAEEVNNKLLLATHKEARPARHAAAERGISKTLQKLREWAKEKLAAEEINHKLLLATDK